LIFMPASRYERLQPTISAGSAFSEKHNHLPINS